MARDMKILTYVEAEEEMRKTEEIIAKILDIYVDGGDGEYLLEAFNELLSHLGSTRTAENLLIE